ncbi:hypothetical protein [Thiothrix nivea]|nr:hypothetical protein [Thiothrix nivea]
MWCGQRSQMQGRVEQPQRLVEQTAPLFGVQGQRPCRRQAALCYA